MLLPLVVIGAGAILLMLLASFNSLGREATSFWPWRAFAFAFSFSSPWATAAI